jgi:rubrerythrin
MGINPVGGCANQFAERGHMLDEGRKTGASSSGDDAEFIEFLRTGSTAVGAYHCSGCGYGVTVHAQLPRCPMCGGTTWEQAGWSPFSRLGRLQ